MKKSWIILSLIVLAAFIAFGVLNANITNYALTDLLGNLSLGHVRLALILTTAFVGIDFIGIARLFSGNNHKDKPVLAAWFIAALLNAILAWWGISVSQIGMGYSALIPIITAAIILAIRICLMMTSGLIGELNRRRYIVKGNNPSVEHFSVYRWEIPSGDNNEES